MLPHSSNTSFFAISLFVWNGLSFTYLSLFSNRYLQIILTIFVLGEKTAVNDVIFKNRVVENFVETPLSFRNIKNTSTSLKEYYSVHLLKKRSWAKSSTVKPSFKSNLSCIVCLLTFTISVRWLYIIQECLNVFLIHMLFTNWGPSLQYRHSAPELIGLTAAVVWTQTVLLETQWVEWVWWLKKSLKDWHHWKESSQSCCKAQYHLKIVLNL